MDLRRAVASSGSSHSGSPSPVAGTNVQTVPTMVGWVGLCLPVYQDSTSVDPSPAEVGGSPAMPNKSRRDHTRPVTELHLGLETKRTKKCFITEKKL